MSTLQEILKELRERLGFSQERFATEIKASLPTVHRWEKGKVTPDSLAISAITDFIRKQGESFSDLYEQFIESTSKGNGQDETLNIKTMEGMLWKAACLIRGEKDAPKFKDYILPLVFIKRLSDVYEDELVRLSKLYGSEGEARDMVTRDHSLVRFYIPPEAEWSVVSGRKTFAWPPSKKPKTLGEQLTHTVRAISKANESLQGVIDIVDYNETRNGEREISDTVLNRLIELLSDPRYRMGLKDVEPDFLGRAYEYLLRKFAEGQGQSAGEFFTPKEVGWLIARIMQPKQGEEFYDPCCGSGGLLIKCQLTLREIEKKIGRPLKLYGQELTGSSFAIARMNMIVHDMEGEIVRGNTMLNPKFLQNSKLKKFDGVVTNPMWNQDNFDPTAYENDPYERFTTRGGYAPASSADWAWIQHLHATLNDEGRAAIVLDTGAVSRGSGSQGENKEKTIRKWFVEKDLIEAVILLPDNLFYNTTAAGIILLLNCAKPKERKGKIILIHAGNEFEKGRPKNFMPETAIQKIAEVFRAWKDVEHLVKVVDKDAVIKADYNLSPSRYIETTAAIEHRDVQTILDELGTLDSEAAKLDSELNVIFKGLGYYWKSR